MKNITKIAFFAFALIFSISANAQLSVGAKLGAGLATLNQEISFQEILGIPIGIDISETNTGLGFQIGGVVEYGISDLFAVEGNVLFTSFNTVFETEADESLMIEGSETKVSIGQIRVPLQAKFYFGDNGNLAFFAKTGPSFGLPITGKTTFTPDEGDEVETDIEFGDDEMSTFKSFELGWDTGIGVAFGPWQISLDALFGLTNNSPSTDIEELGFEATTHNGFYGVNVAYFFIDGKN